MRTPPLMPLWFCIAAGAFPAAAGESEEPVSFRRDIAPVLHQKCAACHGEDSIKGGYRIDTFEKLQQAGDTGFTPLVAGKAEESELYRLIVEPDPHDRMPQKADALAAAEVALIRRWLDEGAVYDGGEPHRPLVEFAREMHLRPAPEFYSRPAPVTALAFSPDGSQLAVSGYYEVTLWNLAEGVRVRRIGGLPERITSLAFHPGGKLLAVAGGTPSQWGAVMLVDLAANDQVRVLCDLTETATGMAFSADGKRLVASAGDRTVRLFDAESGKQERILRHHADWVQTVAFSPDSQRALSASRDRTVRVFSASTGEVETTYQEHDGALVGAVFSTDGNAVLSITRGRTLHFWNARSGNKTGELRDFTSPVQQVAAAPFGAITSAADHLIRVHQLSDRKQLFTLIGHRDEVQALTLSPSGEWLASGSQDGEVMIWSMACGTWLHRWTPSPLKR